MNPADLDPAKLDVPDLAPKAVLLDTDGKPVEADGRSHAERAIAAARRMLRIDETKQAILEAEAVDNRASRRGRVAAWKAERARKAAEPGKARALRRRRAKNAVAKQARKVNRP